MSLIRIEIDLNCRTEENYTYSGFEDIDHEPTAIQGHEPVIVCEPETGVEGFGRVARMDWDKGLVYIRVDWSSLR